MNRLDPAASLLAIRHITGMSQRYVAKQLKVTEKAVKLWEREIRPVPLEVTEWARSQLAQFDDAVDDAVERAMAMVGDPESAPQVRIPYYRTQDQYDRYGYDSCEFERANARARAIGQRLELEGLDVQYIFPGDENK